MLPITFTIVVDFLEISKTYSEIQDKIETKSLEVINISLWQCFCEGPSAIFRSVDGSDYLLLSWWGGCSLKKAENVLLLEKYLRLDRYVGVSEMFILACLLYCYFSHRFVVYRSSNRSQSTHSEFFEGDIDRKMRCEILFIFPSSLSRLWNRWIFFDQILRDVPNVVFIVLYMRSIFSWKYA